MGSIFEQSIILMEKFIEKNPSPFIPNVYGDSKVKSMEKLGRFIT